MQKLLIRRIVISALGAVLIIWLGIYLKGILGSRPSPVRQMSFQESSRTVQAEPVSYQSREISLSNMGKVISERAVAIVSEVQGELLPGDVPLKRGQNFREGQILFKVDVEEAKLSLYAQKSDFMTAVAGILPDLKIDYPNIYPRWQSYFDRLNVEEPLPDLPEISGTQEKVFFSTRNIINQFYTIRSTEERLNKYIVAAPFTGSYADVLQEVGAVVSVGTQVARAVRINQLEIELPVRTDDLDFIRSGMAVNVSSPSNKDEWKGYVKRISDIVDPTTQSVNIYVGFDPRGQRVYDGQYLQVSLPGTKVKDVMEIPRNAVFNQNEVFIVSEDRLSVKPINIVKLNNQTLYFSGLNEGEMVVTEPLVNAFENMEVKVVGDEVDNQVDTPAAAEVVPTKGTALPEEDSLKTSSQPINKSTKRDDSQAEQSSNAPATK